MGEFPGETKPVDPSLEVDDTLPLIDRILMCANDSKRPALQRVSYIGLISEAATNASPADLERLLRAVPSCLNGRDHDVSRSLTAQLPCLAAAVFRISSIQNEALGVVTLVSPGEDIEPAAVYAVQNMKTHMIPVLKHLLLDGGASLQPAAIDCFIAIAAELARAPFFSTTSFSSSSSSSSHNITPPPPPPLLLPLHVSAPNAYKELCTTLWTEVVKECASLDQRHIVRCGAAAVAIGLCRAVLKISSPSSPPLQTATTTTTSDSLLQQIVELIHSLGMEMDNEIQQSVASALRLWPGGVVGGGADEKQPQLQQQQQQQQYLSPLEAEAASLLQTTAIQLASTASVSKPAEIREAEGEEDDDDDDEQNEHIRQGHTNIRVDLARYLMPVAFAATPATLSQLFVPLFLRFVTETDEKKTRPGPKLSSSSNSNNSNSNNNTGNSNTNNNRAYYNGSSHVAIAAYPAIGHLLALLAPAADICVLRHSEASSSSSTTSSSSLSFPSSSSSVVVSPNISSASSTSGGPSSSSALHSSKQSLVHTSNNNNTSNNNTTTTTTTNNNNNNSMIEESFWSLLRMYVALARGEVIDDAADTLSSSLLLLSQQQQQEYPKGLSIPSNATGKENNKSNNSNNNQHDDDDQNTSYYQSIHHHHSSVVEWSLALKLPNDFCVEGGATASSSSSSRHKTITQRKAKTGSKPKISTKQAVTKMEKTSLQRKDTSSASSSSSSSSTAASFFTVPAAPPPSPLSSPASEAPPTLLGTEKPTLMLAGLYFAEEDGEEDGEQNEDDENGERRSRGGRLLKNANDTNNNSVGNNNEKKPRSLLHSRWNKNGIRYIHDDEENDESGNIRASDDDDENTHNDYDKNVASQAFSDDSSGDDDDEDEDDDEGNSPGSSKEDSQNEFSAPVLTSDDASLLALDDDANDDDDDELIIDSEDSDEERDHLKSRQMHQQQRNRDLTVQTDTTNTSSKSYSGIEQRDSDGDFQSPQLLVITNSDGDDDDNEQAIYEANIRLANSGGGNTTNASSASTTSSKISTYNDEEADMMAAAIDSHQLGELKQRRAEAVARTLPGVCVALLSPLSKDILSVCVSLSRMGPSLLDGTKFQLHRHRARALLVFRLRSLIKVVHRLYKSKDYNGKITSALCAGLHEIVAAMLLACRAISHLSLHITTYPMHYASLAPATPVSSSGTGVVAASSGRRASLAGSILPAITAALSSAAKTISQTFLQQPTATTTAAIAKQVEKKPTKIASSGAVSGEGSGLSQSETEAVLLRVTEARVCDVAVAVLLQALRRREELLVDGAIEAAGKVMLFLEEGRHERLLDAMLKAAKVNKNTSAVASASSSSIDTPSNDVSPGIASNSMSNVGSPRTNTTTNDDDRSGATTTLISTAALAVDSTNSGKQNESATTTTTSYENSAEQHPSPATFMLTSPAYGGTTGGISSINNVGVSMPMLPPPASTTTTVSQKLQRPKLQLFHEKQQQHKQQQQLRRAPQSVVADNVGWRLRACVVHTFSSIIPCLSSYLLTSRLIPVILDAISDPVAEVRARAADALAVALGALWHFAKAPVPLPELTAIHVKRASSRFSGVSGGGSNGGTNNTTATPTPLTASPISSSSAMTATQQQQLVNTDTSPSTADLTTRCLDNTLRTLSMLVDGSTHLPGGSHNNRVAYASMCKAMFGIRSKHATEVDGISMLLASVVKRGSSGSGGNTTGNADGLIVGTTNSPLPLLPPLSASPPPPPITSALLNSSSVVDDSLSSTLTPLPRSLSTSSSSSSSTTTAATAAAAASITATPIPRLFDAKTDVIRDVLLQPCSFLAPEAASFIRAHASIPQVMLEEVSALAGSSSGNRSGSGSSSSSSSSASSFESPPLPRWWKDMAESTAILYSEHGVTLGKGNAHSGLGLFTTISVYSHSITGGAAGGEGSDTSSSSSSSSMSHHFQIPIELQEAVAAAQPHAPHLRNADQLRRAACALYDVALKLPLLRLLRYYRPGSYWWREIVPLAGSVAASVAEREWRSVLAAEALDRHLTAHIRKQRWEEEVVAVEEEVEQEKQLQLQQRQREDNATTDDGAYGKPHLTHQQLLINGSNISILGRRRTNLSASTAIMTTMAEKNAVTGKRIGGADKISLGSDFHLSLESLSVVDDGDDGDGSVGIDDDDTVQVKVGEDEEDKWGRRRREGERVKGSKGRVERLGVWKEMISETGITSFVATLDDGNESGGGGVVVMDVSGAGSGSGSGSSSPSSREARMNVTMMRSPSSSPSPPPLQGGERSLNKSISSPLATHVGGREAGGGAFSM